MNRKRYLVIAGIAVAAVVVLAIVFGVVLANHQPVITNLAAPERVLPSAECQIVCNATDRDRDALSYNWSASAGTISGGGAAVNWTTPAEVGSYNVTVTVSDGRGEEVTEQIAIEVRANAPPAITSLIADAQWTSPSGSVQVTCNASDPDGDELNYSWTAAAGDISGAGAAVSWTAPEEVGVYNVTVVAKDGHGSQDTMFLPLSVALGTPPTIEDLVVTPKEHIYLRECTVAGCDYDAWIGKPYDIACNVTDASHGVIYAWSCDSGQISGEGSTITWTAPDKRLSKATVTVIVCDDAGNCAARNIVFWVPICSCGSW